MHVRIHVRIRLQVCAGVWVGVLLSVGVGGHGCEWVLVCICVYMRA